MTEPILISKLVDIKPSTLVKTTSSTLKGLLVLLAIGFIIFSIWRVFNPKPTQSYAQQAENITNTENYYIEDVDKFFLGLKNIPFFFGNKIDIGIGLGKKQIKRDSQGKIIVEEKVEEKND